MPKQHLHELKDPSEGPNQLHNNRSTQPAGNLALSKIFAIFARDGHSGLKIEKKVQFREAAK